MFVTFEKLGFFGSLGNQMFQLAATISYGADNELEVIIPYRESFFEESYGRRVDYIDTGFDLNLKYLSDPPKIDVKLEEKAFQYSPLKEICDQNVSLEGYFQSYKYFQNNNDLIQTIFTNFSKETRDGVSMIATQLPYNKSLTAIHVRRGDYVNKQDYHTLLNLDYYEAAKKEIGENQEYIVFSDDIPWCKDNFDSSHWFIDSGDPFVDLGVMTCCDNFIIANSSFSWWGAWLSFNPNKKVVVPKKWFGPKNNHLSTEDLILPNWIQI
jgi:hypothetical protein